MTALQKNGCAVDQAVEWVFFHLPAIRTQEQAPNAASVALELASHGYRVSELMAKEALSRSRNNSAAAVEFVAENYDWLRFEFDPLRTPEELMLRHQLQVLVIRLSSLILHLSSLIAFNRANRQANT